MAIKIGNSFNTLFFMHDENSLILAKLEGGHLSYIKISEIGGILNSPNNNLIVCLDSNAPNFVSLDRLIEDEGLVLVSGAPGMPASYTAMVHLHNMKWFIMQVALQL